VINEELLTIGEVQARLKCGRTTVYALLDLGPERGGLRGVKMGYSRRVLASDLKVYMESLTSLTDDRGVEGEKADVSS
jgi:excisionase family DNA binding protein